jgi:hypothetical protein
MAALFLARGKPALALGLGGLALFFYSGFAPRWQASAQDFFGRVRAALGAFAFRRAARLSYAESLALYRRLCRENPGAARALEAELDRRFPGWRAAVQGDFDARQRPDSWRNGGEMTEQQAYQTLGLAPGSGPDEIIRAHRRLMKERHPDHGGATDDAARINQAKDRLLRRHD